jgi:hypothetical protein
MSCSDELRSTDHATEWAAGRLTEQRAAHDGRALRRWADVVLRRLPSGPLVLASTSVEGCALAAVVAARRDEPTTWEHLALGRPQPGRDSPVVVVEPLRLGHGTLTTLQRALPGAQVIQGLAATPELVSVA